MKKIVILLIVLVVLTGCQKKSSVEIIHYDRQERQDDFLVEENLKEQEIADHQEESEELLETGIDEQKDLPEILPVSFPATFDHQVTFVSQAPYGNWELPYQEACEEASLIMVQKYFLNQPLDEQIMQQEILALVEWQNQNLGTYTDTSVAELEKVMTEFFNFDYQIIDNVTVEQIKYELSRGNLVVAPFAGRLLGNKYYTAPGPLYHMLVIKGYDRDEFITNDVGTRNGANYKYKYDTLINAIYDLPFYDNGEVFRPYDDKFLTEEQKEQKMTTGRKVIISIFPFSN